jgi:hypothetical protein
MPLLPGDKRISVTFNPANAYLTPDVPLQKASDPTHEHELARILDTIGIGDYLGVIFVGQKTAYFTDDATGNKIAGYLEAPFATLNEGYVAANSRFGTPGSGAKVAVLVIGANTVETAPVQLCSDYVDIYGTAGSVVSGPLGEPIFVGCAGSGMLIRGCEFVANGAPVLAVPAATPMPKGVTFEECVLTNVGAAPAGLEGLIDVRAPAAAPFVLDRCEVRLNNRPLLYFDPDGNTTPYVTVVRESVILTNPSTVQIFEGLDYLGVKLQDSALILGGSAATLFSDYSNSGITVTEIDGLLIRNAVDHNIFPLKILNNARYNTINWNRVESGAMLIVNPAPFTDASFSGDFRNSTFVRLSLSSVTMTLDGLRLFNTVGDIAFTVVAATAATEFVNVRTLTPLQSVADTSALISASGAVAAKFFNCNVSYLLHHPSIPTAVFCGTVIGGSSYGLSNLACLGNPTRQAVLRDHSLLAQPFFVNNRLSATAYPDLNFAGAIQNDIAAPILIQGVRSQGIIDAPVRDLTTTPNRYAYIANSEFTAHDAYGQPWFPSIPPLFNPQAYQRILISAGGRFPNELVRDPGLRSVSYVNQIADRFGPLYVGDPTEPTILQGSSFSVSNPRALRDALNITYTTLYVRLAGGATYVDIVNANLGSWTVLSFVADAGLDNLHLSTVSANLPMTYSYIGENTVRVSIPEPILTVEWLDFVISSLNAQEDASVPIPVTTLDVTQAAAVAIPLGVTTFAISFNPNFTTVPIVVPSLMVPAGNPSIGWSVANESVTAYGFTVTLAAPLTVDGYFLNYIAATTG